jgi:hypothetical protein
MLKFINAARERAKRAIINTDNECKKFTSSGHAIILFAGFLKRVQKGTFCGDEKKNYATTLV